MKIYMIYDKKTQSYWRNGAKGAWLTTGAAKNAIMYKFGCSRDRWKDKFSESELSKEWINGTGFDDRYLSFSNQKRFECREFEMNSVTFKAV